MPLFWKPYKSDVTQFIESLKQRDPQLEERQRHDDHEHRREADVQRLEEHEREDHVEEPEQPARDEHPEREAGVAAVGAAFHAASVCRGENAAAGA